jgi:hypothetical protein
MMNNFVLNFRYFATCQSLLELKLPHGHMECLFVTTPLLEECEDDTHTPEMGTWESFGTLKTL